MFTGIIETTGRVSAIQTQGTNSTFWIESPISSQLSIDQSVAHNGVCLTVEEIRENAHRITAVAETLKKTNLTHWQQDSVINLERCLPMNGRLDGHMVQGHVDAVATCLAIDEKDGSWEFLFRFDPFFAALVIEKGSISVNGISLTLFNVGNDRFQVAIIPYTYEHTNLKHIKVGEIVNLEFDMIGKYVNRFLQFR